MAHTAILAALTRGPCANATAPRQAGASVNKHLVCLLIICTAIAGCHNNKSTTQPSPVSGLPPGSFARLWTQPLDLHNDPPRALHLTNDYVFAYTRDHVVYTIGRSG